MLESGPAWPVSMLEIEHVAAPELALDTPQPAVAAPECVAAPVHVLETPLLH